MVLRLYKEGNEHYISCDYDYWLGILCGTVKMNDYNCRWVMTLNAIIPESYHFILAISIIHFSTPKSIIITPISFIFFQTIIIITRSIPKSLPIYHYALVQQ